jgi:curved DNA-binding protein CbpA
MKVNDKVYQLLGLPDFASIDDVKKAYRKLALQHHPDKGGDTAKMQQINLAYEVLSKEKDKYDAWLHNVRTPRQQFRVIITTGWGYSGNNTTTTTSWTGF